MSTTWRIKDGKISRGNSNSSPDYARKSNSQNSTPRGSVRGKKFEQDFSASKTTLRKGIASPSSFVGADVQSITVGSTSFPKVQKYSLARTKDNIRADPLSTSPREVTESNSNDSQSKSPRGPGRYEKLKRVPLDLKQVLGPTIVGEVKVRATPKTGRPNQDLSPLSSHKNSFPKRTYKKTEADRDKPINRSSS